MSAAPKTLQQAIQYFADPENCRQFMVELRWPDGKVTCPNCGSENVKWLPNANLFKCFEKHPRQKFSLKVGTVFEDSPIGLDKWLPAIWLIVNCKNGVSSYEVARALGVTQKTAWFMLHRIRLAMGQNDSDKLSGQVEADETFIGGKARNMHRGKWTKIRELRAKGRTNAGRSVVLGILQRHGKIRVGHVPDNRKGTVQEKITSTVVPGSEVFTDEL